MTEKRKQEDSSVSLHPLTFDEAIAKLAQPKREDSQAAASGSTKEPDGEPAHQLITDVSDRGSARPTLDDLPLAGIQ
jgi:hypothetical protein